MSRADNIFFSDHVLKNRIVAVHHVTSEIACGLKCSQHDRCLSYSYRPISDKQKRVCQLHDANRVTCPSCFAMQPDTTYYEDIKVLNMKRISLCHDNDRLKYTKSDMILSVKQCLFHDFNVLLQITDSSSLQTE